MIVLGALQNTPQPNTLSNMSNDDPILTDQKIAASEARAETKLARLEGKIDLISQSISTLSRAIDAQRREAASNRTSIIATILATALAMAGLGYAALSYGATSFYNGTVVRDIAQTEAIHAVRAAAEKGGLTK